VTLADNQSSLKAGLRGPTVLADFILREKITHFDHERIPERVVHARGSGAHGYFECTERLTDVTRAAPFQKTGKRTPVLVRFSTVAGERGFAVKFYTDEGNWDLVGNNMPVLFIQDAMKLPDLVHAVRPEPHNGIQQAASAHDTFWDFASLMPESTHMLCWITSDRAIPRSPRMMQGFGVHTFRFIDAEGASTFVKSHWTRTAGVKSLVRDEAVKISGADPDFHRRDLWEANEAGAYPEWTLGVQLFTEEQAAQWSFDVLDATKIVPEELVPVRTVGRLVLDRNPDTFFLRKRSRSPSARRTSFPASTSATIHCWPADITPISTRNCRDSAGRTSTSCRSTHRSPVSPTTSATAFIAWPCTVARWRTSRTRSAAAVRSRRAARATCRFPPSPTTPR